jgi:hypothetical protein
MATTRAAGKAAIDNGEARPTAPEVQPENVPAELRERDQWVCWGYERRHGKWTKIPVDPGTGRLAKSTDPKTWGTFDEALAYYRAHRSTIDGIGYVFSEDDPFAGVDLDDALPPSSLDLRDWAVPFVHRLKSYGEVSPSRTGIKIIGRGKKKGTRCKRAFDDHEVEIYDRGRFFVITGIPFPGSPISVLDFQAGLDWAYDRVFAGGVASLTDADLLERMFASAGGGAIRSLYGGSILGHNGDPSRADLALCDHLAWWTDYDRERTDRLFRESGLMRGKWDEARGEQTYGEKTLDKAFEGKRPGDGYDLTKPRPNQPPAGYESKDMAAPVPDPPPWPSPPGTEAYHGIAGQIVHAIEPASEADPAALLVQVLVAFGNAIGRSAYYRVEADLHRGNEFAVLVGKTSKARKGTSWGHVFRLFREAEEQWATDRVQTGLSSGEGLVWAVRDPIMKRERNKERGEPVRFEEVEADPGVADKRLLVCEPEFANVLKQTERQGNTLSAILRQAWDGGDLRTLTKNVPARASGAHVSLIGHITADELRRYLTQTETANGYGNRHLWVCTERSKLLPEGGKIDPGGWAAVRQDLGAALEFGRRAGEVVRDDGARQIWRAVYGELSEGRPGLAGSLLARGEAHVVRLSLLYALLDHSAVVRAEHLLAALALWDYCQRSVEHIWGDSLGDPLADELLAALRSCPAGLTRNDLCNLCGRNQSSERIGQALGLLLRHGRVRREREQTRGRPAERWFAATRDFPR